MTGMLRELMYLLLLPVRPIADQLQSATKTSDGTDAQGSRAKKGRTLEEQARLVVDALARRVRERSDLSDRVLEEIDRDPEVVRVGRGRAVEVGQEELANPEVLHVRHQGWRSDHCAPPT